MSISRIVAKHSGGSRGPIESYKLDDGRIVSHRQACGMADKGEIEGGAIFTTRDNKVGLSRL